MIPYKETINTTITITFVNFFSTPASRFLFLLNFYIHSCIFFPCFITFSSLWSPLIHFYLKRPVSFASHTLPFLTIFSSLRSLTSSFDFFLFTFLSSWCSSVFLSLNTFSLQTLFFCIRLCKYYHSIRFGFQFCTPSSLVRSTKLHRLDKNNCFSTEILVNKFHSSKSYQHDSDLHCTINLDFYYSTR